jgi:hypothetical protein
LLNSSRYWEWEKNEVELSALIIAGTDPLDIEGNLFAGCASYSIDDPFMMLMKVIRPL